ncbi:hypothetical protein PIB30_107061 [Stylosanthes scabra]|uniref:Secreted protein n=1 Tax=Stylosanthes scabra TaxID=79078 RepID=A0ABU6RZW4_9FABA|nr:hypothetical protein [Stylosanthes scabra]
MAAIPSCTVLAMWVIAAKNSRCPKSDSSSMVSHEKVDCGDVLYLVKELPFGSCQHQPQISSLPDRSSIYPGPLSDALPRGPPIQGPEPQFRGHLDSGGFCHILLSLQSKPVSPQAPLVTCLWYEPRR